MPSAPLRFCTVPGCSTRVERGPCAAHRRAKEKARGTRHARGYTNQWDTYSKQRLARYPLCEGYPKGIHQTPTMATCTDHILSARQYPERFNDPANHQSLCDDCNKRKAIAEEGGFGRPHANRQTGGMRNV